MQTAPAIISISLYLHNTVIISLISSLIFPYSIFFLFVRHNNGGSSRRRRNWCNCSELWVSELQQSGFVLCRLYSLRVGTDHPEHWKSYLQKTCIKRKSGMVSPRQTIPLLFHLHLYYCQKTPILFRRPV